jgi:superoxide dismutase
MVLQQIVNPVTLSQLIANTNPFFAKVAAEVATTEAVWSCLVAGGGVWNHALFFKHLAPASSPNADPAKSISKDLSAAITSSFGSLAKMQEEVTTAATKVFGSGWAWVCYTGK